MIKKHRCIENTQINLKMLQFTIWYKIVINRNRLKHINIPCKIEKKNGD